MSRSGRFFRGSSAPALAAADSSSSAHLHQILHLAWPTMLEQFLQTAVQYADTAMVGSLGTMAIAAVGCTSTMNWLINGTLSGASVGFLALASQSLGAGKHQEVRRISVQALLAALGLGGLFSVVCLGLSSQIPRWMQADAALAPLASRYFFIMSLPLLFRSATVFFGTMLRAVQDTKTPMKAGLYANGINVLLNLLLIYDQIAVPGTSLVVPGAGLGIEGAAIASALSFCFGGLFLSWTVWRHPLLSFRHQPLHPDWDLLHQCARISLPGIAQRFATSLGYVAFASMINSTGSVSTAAHTIANTVESAFYIPGWGMQAAMASLCGHALGANQADEIQGLKRSALRIELVLMGCSGFLLFVLAPVLLRLFTQDAEVIHLGKIVLQMVALSEPIYGVPIILEGIMMGLGQTLVPFWLNISGMWGIRIVGTWICTQVLGLGLIAAWGCMIAHNLYLFAAFVGYDRRHPLHLLARQLQAKETPPSREPLSPCIEEEYF